MQNERRRQNECQKTRIDYVFHPAPENGRETLKVFYSRAKNYWMALDLFRKNTGGQKPLRPQMTEAAGSNEVWYGRGERIWLPSSASN
jgi:hypothetical protein